MRYFCEHCDGKSPEEMMRIAMSTVESEYTVVGVLEMFNASLAVFQEYLPGRSTQHNTIKTTFYDQLHLPPALFILSSNCVFLTTYSCYLNISHV